MNYCLNRVAYLKIICTMNMSLLPHDIGFLSHFSSQWCSQWCCHDSSHNCRGYYCTACCCTVCGRLCCATIQKEGHSVRYVHMPHSDCYMCLFYWVRLSKLHMERTVLHSTLSRDVTDTRVCAYVTLTKHANWCKIFKPEYRVNKQDAGKWLRLTC